MASSPGSAVLSRRLWTVRLPNLGSLNVSAAGMVTHETHGTGDQSLKLTVHSPWSVHGI